MPKTFTTPKGTVLPLMDLKGKDYLQVQWRIVWMREEKSEWSVTTDFIVLNEKYAIAKATVSDPTGRVIATAHKREDQKDFGDFEAKAEAGAIGRALAYIGYGTQFCADELDEGDRSADAPVERPKAKATQSPGAAAVPFARPTEGGKLCACGGVMMRSKFGPGWYCAKCRATAPAGVEADVS